MPDSDSARSPDQPRGRRTDRRWGPIIVIGLFLVAVVVLASGTSAARHGGSTTGDLLIVAMTVLVGAAAVGLAVTAWMRRAPGGPATTVDDTDSVLDILRRQHLVALAITVVLLGLFVGTVASYLERNAPPRTRQLPRATATTLPKSEDQVDSGGGSTSGTWRLLLAGGLAVAAVGAAVVATRSRVAGRGTGRATTEVADALTASIADLDDLDANADDRRVVIRCYARMERAAALGGVATAAADTPADLVSRIVAGTDADPVACQRLRDLFERARFSTHPVDTAMRAEAADSLRTIRAALLARRPTPVAPAT